MATSGRPRGEVKNTSVAVRTASVGPCSRCREQLLLMVSLQLKCVVVDTVIIWSKRYGSSLKYIAHIWILWYTAYAL